MLKRKKRGPTGNRTPTKGFKVLCADRYTIGLTHYPCFLSLLKTHLSVQCPCINTSKTLILQEKCESLIARVTYSKCKKEKNKDIIEMITCSVYKACLPHCQEFMTTGAREDHVQVWSSGSSASILSLWLKLVEIVESPFSGTLSCFL